MSTKRTVIKNARILNEGKEIQGDILIENDLIYKIAPIISNVSGNHTEYDAKGHYVMPGIIDDQVHFREPGLTHKATIATESAAAAAGGVTSFMEMPNTVPQALTQKLLQDKYDIAERTSVVNYSFFMGVSNDNIEEVLKTDIHSVCGIKIFMGSSTGSMLVDNDDVLEQIFSKTNHLISTHCESESIIKANLEAAIDKYGNNIPPFMHPIIRNNQACEASSDKARALATKYSTRLHILHITTAEEANKGSVSVLDKNKRITMEACVHHLFFNDSDYERLGNQIKCNPAIKTKTDQDAIWAALKSGAIDVIATDHAPHTWDEKQQEYLKSPSGLPLIQHSLQLMLTMMDERQIDLHFIVDKMCHKVADCFNLNNRGYIREGYFADLVCFDADASIIVKKQDLLYKCGWSPLEGKELRGKILSTWCNGGMVFDGVKVINQGVAKRLTFN
jgi:dihydroorotase